MAYYAVKEGTNYAIYNNGQRVATTSPQGLVGYGLSESNLGSRTTAQTPAQTQAAPAQTYTTPSGAVVNAAGQIVSQPQSQPQPVQQPQGVPQSVTQMINSTSLSSDQKQILNSYANAVFSKSPEVANQISGAIQATTQFAAPEFKAQAAMIQDALARNFSAQEGDLAFKETQLKSTLDNLKNDVAASKDYLSFQNRQQLEELATSYQQDLQNTVDQMAATGFTTSSKRSRAEQLLSDANSRSVESSNRQFAYQNSSLDRQLQQGDQNYAQQLAYYRDLAAKNKLALLRDAESKIGSDALSSYASLPQLVSGAQNVLGGQTGSLNYDLTKTITGGLGNFVF